MNKFDNLKGSALWPEVIAHRLGDGIKASEIQKMAFALRLETVIPKLIERTKLTNPDREILRSMKEKADNLYEALESIRNASEQNKYIEDIIAFSLLHKSDRMDFLDVYWFADAFRGFLQDDLDKIKSGKDSASDLYICVCICWVYESYLGVVPTCRDGDYASDGGDINDASPYEKVCLEINRRYKTDLTWSTRRKAKKVYKTYFEKKKEALAKMDKL